MFTMRNSRKSVALGSLAILVVAGVSCSSAKESPSSDVVVYKTPWCGCCEKWADHMRENGFAVTTEELNDLTEVKLKQNVGREISSCHTALVDGYVIEGHVPADVIRRLLKERPPVVGLTVPGMPIGSPGMERGAYKEPYEVLTFDREGNTQVYARR
jgi:hypothetical protein